MEKIELFVPGRLCLLGEHSDWAGLHRVMNSAIIPGQAIVTGIEQGIYAEVEKIEEVCFRGYETDEHRGFTELIGTVFDAALKQVEEQDK